MPSKNKAQYDVIVDVNVKTGKVDVTSLLKRLSDQISTNLKKIQAKEVELPVDFNLDKSKDKIRKAFMAVEQALNKEKKSLQAKASRGSEIGGLLGPMLGSLTKDGKIVENKLKEALGKVAQQLNKPLSSKITKRSPLAPLLSMVGKDLTQAKADLKNFQLGFEKALNNISTRSKEAAAQQKQAFSDLSNALDTNIANKAGKTSESINKITAAVQKLKEAQSKLSAGGLGSSNDRQRLATLSKFKTRVEAVVADLTTFRDKLKAAGGADKDLEKVDKALLGVSKLLVSTTDKVRKLNEELSKKNPKSRQESKDLSDLQKAINAVTSSQERLNDARSKTATSRKSGNAAEVISALKGERAAVLNVITSVQRQIKIHKELGKGTVALSSQLRSLNKDARNLEKSLRGPTKTMLEFANSLKTFVRFAVAFKVLGGLSQGINFLTGNVISLQDALKSIQAVSNSTAEEMVVVENAIKNVATTTQFTTTEIAESAQTLAQAGIGSDKIADTLSAVANFASATNAGLTVAADLVSTMKNVFNDLDPVQIADELTNAINISKLTAGDLQTILSRLAQTSKSFNITSKQMLSAVTVLKNAGIKASTVSTGLRQGLLELLSPDAKTLKVLQKRYAAIGENLSQATISNLFSNFSQEDNPILRVLNELEKLGIQGSGAKDFERVFDVRAENVIKALIANKEQFVLNNEAIGRTGSAAKGTRVQLESLSKATSNLSANMSVLASDVSTPLLDFFKDIVNGATEAVGSIRQLINSQKELTGSSGVGASLQAGAAVGSAVAVKGGGAVKAALSGAVAAVITGAFNTQSREAQGATEGVTKSISVVASIVAAIGLFKSFFPGKEVSALSSKAEFIRKKVSGVKGFVGTTTKLLGKLNVLFLTLTSVAGIIDLFVDENAQEALKRIAAQRASLGGRVEDTKKDIADLENKVSNLSTRDSKSADTARQITLLESTIEQVTGSASNAAVDFLNEAAKGVKDADSGVFKENLAKFNSLLAGSGLQEVSASNFVSLLQETSDLIDKAEGERALFAQELKAAYSSADQPDSQEFIKAFEQMSSEQQAVYSNYITDAKDATEFYANQGNVFKSDNSLQEAQEQVEVQRQILKDLQLKDFEKQMEGVKNAQKEAKRGLGSAILDKGLRGFSSASGFLDLFLSGGTSDFLNDLKEQREASKELAKSEEGKARGRLAELVESGKENTVKQFLQLLEDDSILSKAAQDQAIKDVKANAGKDRQKQLQDKLNELALKGQEQPEDQKTIEQVFQQSAEATVTFETQAFIDSENKAQLLREQVTINQELRDNYLQQKEALKDGVVQNWELVSLTEKAKGIVERQKEIEGKILKAKASVLEGAQKIADLERSFVLDEAKISEIDRQLAESKKAQLQDVEKTSELAKKRFLIERRNLNLLEEALEQEIKKVLKGKAVDTEGLGLTDILTKFSGEGGRDFIRSLPTEDAKVLAGLFKKAAEVTDDLVSAEERLVQELDNTLRKPLADELKKAESSLTKQHNKTSKLEGQLSKATDKLAKAREDLAKSYDKQAENELFFKGIDREFSGEAEVQKGDAKDLLDRAASASTNEESIKLAKEAITTAKTLLDQGDLSKSRATKIKDKAKGAIRQATSADIREKQEEVNRRIREEAVIAEQLRASIASEKALQASVDGLKSSIDNLPDKIKKAIAAINAGSPKDKAKGQQPLEKSAKKTNRASKRLEDAASNAEDSLTTSSERLSAAASRLSSAASSLGDAGFNSGGDIGGGGDAKKFADNSVGVSFVKDLGKNTAEVAEADTTRLTNLQQSGVDPDSALAKSILQSVNPSVIPMAEGGVVNGPGSGTDDKAGLFALSNNEFVQPSKATEFYGKGFMEQVRSLKFPVDAVRNSPAAASSSVESNQSGAQAVAKAAGAGSSLRPVTLNVEGAKFSSNATDDSIKSFRKSLSMQSLKAGTK